MGSLRHQVGNSEWLGKVLNLGRLATVTLTARQITGTKRQVRAGGTERIRERERERDARREGRCFIMCTLAWWGKLDKGPQEGPHMPVLVQVSLRGSIARLNGYKISAQERGFFAELTG